MTKPSLALLVTSILVIATLIYYLVFRRESWNKRSTSIKIVYYFCTAAASIAIAYSVFYILVTHDMQWPLF
jgi:hypothetical protein